jgi:cell division protein FtsQ
MTRHRSSSSRRRSAHAVATLPAVVPVRRLRPLIYGGGALLTGLVAVALSLSFDLPAKLSAAAENATASAGFAIVDVEIEGLHHTPRLDVHSAIAKSGGALLFANVDAMKLEVEKLPWVAQATVTRQLPGKVIVSVTERKPFALWQHDRKLALIDASGEVLQRHGLGAFSHLPMIVGEDANRRIGQLFADLEQVPALRERLDGASWIGNRRWDVRFKSGETLQLPEGRRETQAALVAFAQLDAANGLLGRGTQQFDMRLADRLFVRQHASQVVQGSGIKTAHPSETAI